MEKKFFHRASFIIKKKEKNFFIATTSFESAVHDFWPQRF
jgi:hypothetical protein